MVRRGLLASVGRTNAASKVKVRLLSGVQKFETNKCPQARSMIDRPQHMRKIEKVL